METKTTNNQNLARFSLDASFQGVNRLFVFASDNTTLDIGNEFKETVIENIFFQE